MNEMNVLDSANEIAISIKNSKYYGDYLESIKKINENPELKRKIREFKQKHIEYQSKCIQNQETSFEEEKYVSGLYHSLMLNDNAKIFFKSEEILLKLLGNIYNILGSECVLDLDFL